MLFCLTISNVVKPDVGVTVFVNFSGGGGGGGGGGGTVPRKAGALTVGLLLEMASRTGRSLSTS